MLSKSTKSIEEIITETEELIDTLEILNSEIESYELAKNNLIEIKDKLSQFVYDSGEALKVSKDNIVSIKEILNLELVEKLNNIQITVDEIVTELKSNTEVLKADVSNNNLKVNIKLTFITIIVIVNIIIGLLMNFLK